jgi:uncharacterized CHY-type Zn-finger protein
MAVDAPTRCAHCRNPITDQTTQVVSGGLTYCCSNCSAAVEQHGPGSDPDSATGKNHLQCAHCRVPIVNEANMTGSGDQIFCCPNCESAAGRSQTPAQAQTQRTR